MIHISKIINKDNYKKLLAIDLSLIVICLFLLVTYFSFAYYNNDLSIRFLNAKVGNFLTNNSDLSIVIYVQNASGTNKYRIASDVPELGYSFKEVSCKNDSIINYDDVTKQITVSVNQKDECSLFFDIEKTADLSMHIMIEENFNTEKYIETKNNDKNYIFDLIFLKWIWKIQ